MAEKITISIPDELYGKMQKYKNDFIFSKVFRDAISEQIERKESFTKRLKEDAKMDAIIERLRQEKAKTMGDCFEDGKNEGLNFAKSAHFEDLQAALKLELIDLNRDHSLWDNYFEPTMEEDIRLDFYPNDYGDFGEATQQWFEGWKEGVQAFWDEVEDKL